MARFATYAKKENYPDTMLVTQIESQIDFGSLT